MGKCAWGLQQAPLQKPHCLGNATRGISLGSDSQGSTTAGSEFSADRGDPMEEGALVVVLEDFMSNSRENKVLLKRGQLGVVSRVDDDGDVLVKFADHRHKEWVTGGNFGKLRVSNAANAAKIQDVS